MYIICSRTCTVLKFMILFISNRIELRVVGTYIQYQGTVY